MKYVVKRSKTKIQINAFVDGAEVKPWFIRINPGCAYWPNLTFPFIMPRELVGTFEGQDYIAKVLRAVLRTCASYYKVYDCTGEFWPLAELLDTNQVVIHPLEVIRSK